MWAAKHGMAEPTSWNDVLAGVSSTNYFREGISSDDATAVEAMQAMVHAEEDVMEVSPDIPPDIEAALEDAVLKWVMSNNARTWGEEALQDLLRSVRRAGFHNLREGDTLHRIYTAVNDFMFKDDMYGTMLASTFYDPDERSESVTQCTSTGSNTAENAGSFSPVCQKRHLDLSDYFRVACTIDELERSNTACTIGDARTTG